MLTIRFTERKVGTMSVTDREWVFTLTLSFFC